MSTTDQLKALIDVTRKDWGGGARPRPLTPVVHPYPEVHHSVYSESLPLIEHARRIESQHLGQGWNGSFYNLGIHNQSGQIIELRGPGWKSIGAYESPYSDGSPVDPRALTIVLFGDFTHSEVSDAAQRSLQRIRAILPDKRMRWHRMRAKTACPGNRAVPVLQTLNHTSPEEDDMTEEERQKLWWMDARIAELHRLFAPPASGIPKEWHSAGEHILSMHHTIKNMKPGASAQEIESLIASQTAVISQMISEVDTGDDSVDPLTVLTIMREVVDRMIDDHS